MKANVTANSQAHRLRERMEEANIRHGQTVSADLSNVRVLATAGQGGEIFFCNMGVIRVKRVFEPGDQAPLPNGVVLDGLEFSETTGNYDIHNALISANGSIRIHADERTTIRPHTGGVLSRLFSNSTIGA